MVEYHRSTVWPYGRLFRNLSGCHVECVINNKKVLLCLGSSIKTIVCTIRQLREHGVCGTK